MVRGGYRYRQEAPGPYDLAVKRTPLRAKIRRDCKTCRRRVELQGSEWFHVKPRADCETPVPFATKRTPKKSSENRAKDREWARGILTGPDGLPRPCVACGGSQGIQAAHIIPRSQSRAVHWDPANGLPLCAGPGSNSCHYRFDTHQINRLGLIEATIGLDAYRALNVAASRAPDRGLTIVDNSP